MKTLGIIAEYNPFHNGHAYQIARARQLVNPDCVAVCMSGDFTQRGSAAILDKWTKAELALSDPAQATPDRQAPAGADLVVELPFVFACNRASIFARGGVDSLVSLGATHIAFGCEAENPAELLNIADALDEHESILETMTAETMKSGLSRAKAFEKAVAATLGESAAELLQKPNNILAVEYLRRISCWQKQGRELEAVPIQRIGSGYAEANAEAGFAGATAIRQMLLNDRSGKDSDVRDFVPTSVYDKLPDGASLKRAESKYYELIRAELVRKSAEELACIYSIGEGIENRFKKAVVESDSLESLVEAVTSRRYTSAAVRRMLTYILLGLDKGRVDALIHNEDPLAASTNACRYLRLLAANNRGRQCIRACKDEEAVPFITNINKDLEQLDEAAADMLAIDILAADMWNIIHGRDIYAGSDKVVRPRIR